MTRGRSLAFAALAATALAPLVPVARVVPAAAVTAPPIVFECPGAPAERPVLTTGSKGPCVGYLERFLRYTYDPYTNKGLYPNLSFNVRTYKAVIRLQSDYQSTDPRGVVGASTWQIIDDILAVLARGVAFSERYANFHLYGASHTHFSRKILERMLHAAGIEAQRLSGLSGTATVLGKSSALARLRQRVKLHDIPDLIVIATGVNDLGMTKRADPTIRTLTDPAEIDAANLRVFDGWVREFMEYVDTLPGPPAVVWLTVAKRDPDLNKDELFNDALRAEQARRAALADPALATLTLVDTAASMNEHPELYGRDGTHLTLEGYRQRPRCTVDALLAFETFGNETVFACRT